jgi:hypothetical protein
MPAVQVNTTTTPLVAADADQWRFVLVSNLGPNTIFLGDPGQAATTAGGLAIPSNSSVGPIRLPPNLALNAIAATAAQVSPADTRVLVT